MTLNVLGTDYTVEYRRYQNDPVFERLSIDGYCSKHQHLIVVGLMSTFPEFAGQSEEIIRAVEEETLRHEIIHAFLNESGLCDSASPCEVSWAKNEEMIDWFALQGPKIFAVWKEANLL